jgi:8-oxo-dGTP diphosphatase
VVAAVIYDEECRVLLGRRHPAAHQGGLWEFPGGKVEPDETAREALTRELREELGISPTVCRPLIRVPHRYPRYAVLLEVWRVDAFSGVPRGLEGQPITWVEPHRLASIPMPAANRPVATAARLPSLYLITPEPEDTAAFLLRLERQLRTGIRLVQLRARRMASTALRQLAQESLSLCQRYRAELLLNAEPELVEEAGAHGVHLTGAQLMGLERRPLGRGKWVAASCHDAEELAKAREIGADFAVLSPVLLTRSHPGAEPLGWEAFRKLVEPCPFPVYALGGMRPQHLPIAFEHGAQGIAAISAFWDA